MSAPAEAPRLPLTVIVLTLNEAGHIADCLAAATALQPAELLVLDSGSADTTLRLAKAAGARLATRPFDGHANQRNHALSLATTEWVFFVDADERVTPTQAAEIAGRIGHEAHAGYWVPRHNYVLGRRLRGGGWWPDEQLRLLRRGAAHYDPARQVHEVVLLQGSAGHLREPLVHYNYDSWAQIHRKQRTYTRRAVADALAAGQTIRWRNYLLQPARAVYRRFITWHGYRDGWLGLALALVLAYYEFLFYWWLGRAQRRRRSADR